MIGEMVSAVTVTAAAKAHTTQANGRAFWETVAAGWWGIIAIGTAVNIPKFARMPMEKRPGTRWCVPVLVIAGISAAFQFLVALSRL